MVADGARADVMKRLLDDGRLPNIRKHLVERGSFRTALTVYPSTTGPAHIPFVCGLHPGTANIPGYRWLDRHLHDRRRRSIYRHRSLNSPHGLMVGRDMDHDRAISLFEYFDRPSSVLELIDYCPNQKLYKVIVRRLFRIVQAHKKDDWSKVDGMVERLIMKRIRAGSECIIGSFFGIDEYSHLYDPNDDRTIAAYENIDRAIGEIVDVLIDERVYDETILAVVSDHGLTGTEIHIPLVDIVKEHGYSPFYYPKLYRRSRDSAVCESGNSMAQIYLNRGNRWGEHWTYEELMADPRAGKLIDNLITREGVSFVATRAANDAVVFKTDTGILRATRADGKYEVAVEGTSPLPDHPVGTFTPQELLEKTYGAIYPDAVNQVFMLTAGSRSGDIIVNADKGYDLRLQHEDPEHHGSHGSLHRDHMHVPLITSFPIVEQYVSNCDLVPTILHLCGKKPERPTDGRILDTSVKVTAVDDDAEKPSKASGALSIVITLAIILCGVVLTAIFEEDIRSFGADLLTRYGQEWVDLVLFLLTAISSTPLALPIWAYTMVGVSLGYGVMRLAIVMALGSATGSLVTFLLGRYFGETAWLKRRFPKVKKHPWTYGKSRWYVTMMLFLGTASPLPCDVFYVACGIKRYPVVLFWVTMVAARLVRYIYLGYGFLYAPDLFDKFF